MADILFVLIIMVLFGVAVLFVRACERIIGADVEEAAETTELAGIPDGGSPTPDEGVAA